MLERLRVYLGNALSDILGKDLKKASTIPRSPEGYAVFKAWFDIKAASSLGRTYESIPDSEVLPMLHAILLRTGAQLNRVNRLIPAAEAQRAYDRIRRKYGEGIGAAVQLAVCATVEEMRDRYERKDG